MSHNLLLKYWIEYYQELKIIQFNEDCNIKAEDITENLKGYNLKRSVILR